MMHRYDIRLPDNTFTIVSLTDRLHSINADRGLGDRGRAGLEDFSKQHKCNTICKALGLTPASDTWDSLIREEGALDDILSVNQSDISDADNTNTGAQLVHYASSN